MLFLSIRTDNPKAEIGLFENNKQLAYQTWQAHRQLAETLHQQITTMLQLHKKDWHDIDGIICFKGPGSFTGLRIGLTVGNALANALNIPIVSETSEDWIKKGQNRLQTHQTETVAMPHYGSPVHITQPRK